MKYAWYQFDTDYCDDGSWMILGSGYVKDISKWSSVRGLGLTLFGPTGPNLRTMTPAKSAVTYIMNDLTGEPLGKLVRIPKPKRRENGW